MSITPVRPQQRPHSVGAVSALGAAPAGQRLPRAGNTARRFIRAWNELGYQIAFCIRALGLAGEAIARYKTETLRLVATMSLGVGALAAIGGTVVVVSTLTFSTGMFSSIQLFSNLSNIGVQAFSGFASAYIITRLVSPLISTIGLAATIGAGATAELGAMRISEEIDALESMSIRSVSYLVSTRVVAGVLVVIPLWSMVTLAGYLAFRIYVVVVSGQAPGVYNHYFYTYLQPTDLIWSLVQVVVMGIIIMLIHTYYGFHASGGPAGVGEAVGRSMRVSLIAAVTAALALAMAAYGVSGGFNLSG
ncbi:ABC transporter permease [Mycobacterium heckeshornense]|uniref:ABC transporter permease n=1 Tax=Mycobacterium heckeshornense TaxID=110505 RepID=UPI001945438C|nr:ABC transporter permease [Mycobacterium heckeshornense]BCQ07300.1 ABC transporter permease [Mycobacterium heckeshornense]